MQNVSLHAESCSHVSLHAKVALIQYPHLSARVFYIKKKYIGAIKHTCFSKGLDFLPPSKTN